MNDAFYGGNESHKIEHKSQSREYTSYNTETLHKIVINFFTFSMSQYYNSSSKIIVNITENRELMHGKCYPPGISLFFIKQTT